MQAKRLANCWEQPKGWTSNMTLAGEASLVLQSDQATMSSDIQQEASFQALLAHTARIAEDVDAHADQIENDRAIPKTIVEDLLEHGFFKLILPSEIGGHGLGLDQFHEILNIFSQVDASVGWCINQNNVFATNFAKADVRAQQEVWANDRTVVANGPPGIGTRATIADGGYTLSGEWFFSSGITHANWVAALSPVFEDDASEPTAMLHFLIPIESVEIKDDWHVGGLRGTGSHCFKVTNHFVPSHLAFDATSTPENPTRYTAISTTPLFATGFAMVATSAAAAAVHAAIDTSKEKTAFASDTALRHDATVQRSIGIASAKVYTVRACLRAIVGRIWDDSASLEPLGLDARMTTRLASTHAIQEAAQATDIVYQVCGSTAIFASDPIQRRFQDVHTITQQVQGRLPNYDTVGQWLLDLEPKGVY